MIDKIISAIADCISLETVRTIPVPASGMSFPDLEIRQSQHQVLFKRVNVIYNLRKKIEPDSKNPVYIKTVLGVGYKFSG